MYFSKVLNEGKINNSLINCLEGDGRERYVARLVNKINHCDNQHGSVEKHDKRG